jgi:hypothetical protein
MRMIFSLIGLLIVVAVIGTLAKKQLSTVTQLPTINPNSATNPANMAEQSQQIQTQVKDQIGAAMEAAAAARVAAESK